MFTDVEEKIKRKNQILFSRESECIQALRTLFCEQTHLTLVLWAFDCMQIPVSELTARYPQETDVKAAYDASLAWAHGEIKMPLARKAILSCHAVAKRIDDADGIALCHAIGQGCGTVHVETHAMGLVCYELTARVIQCGYTDYKETVRKKIEYYTERLRWWQENAPGYSAEKSWAGFLTRPEQTNKEKLLAAKLRER